MTPTEFFDLSLSIQTALGAGYLGYATAYAGYRKDHGVEDAVFISIAFGSISLLTFNTVSAVSDVAAFASAFLVAILAAGIWRKWGRRLWLWCVSSLNIHRDDGAHSAWSQIVQTDRLVGQVSVHLKSGRVLYMTDRRPLEASPWQGLYLGGDGSVVMAVQEEELSDGREETREGVTSEWGTRMTYIPASEVARVDIRML